MNGEIRRAKIIALARGEYACDEINVDDDAKLSEGDANGAWVQAWVWVNFSDTEFDKEIEE